MLSEKHKICCFIGHRTINRSSALTERLSELILYLISEGTRVFLFGSNSEFDELCYECVTKLRENNLDIKRVYVKAEYFNADRAHAEFLNGFFESTVCPANLFRAGKAVYIKRNFYMIDVSDFCVFYYDKTYSPVAKQIKNSQVSHFAKSGTKIAYDYAKKKNKMIINLFDK